MNERRKKERERSWRKRGGEGDKKDREEGGRGSVRMIVSIE